MLKKLYYKLFQVPHVNNLVLINSMQRSGSHAVASWLTYQFRETYPIEPVNSFREPDFHWCRCGEGHANLFINCIKGTLKENDEKYLNKLMNNFGGRYPSIDNIVMLDEFCEFKSPELYPIKRLNTKRIISIRDPFNTFASCFKHFGTVAPHLVQRWQFLAERALNSKEHYVILYNKWFSDREYRKQICRDLKIPFNDYGKNMVPDFGNGSSFDKFGYDGFASEMPVLTRFQKYSSNRVFLDVFRKNPRIIELSEQLFGIIDETENFKI